MGMGMGMPYMGSWNRGVGFNLGIGAWGGSTDDENADNNNEDAQFDQAAFMNRFRKRDEMPVSDEEEKEESVDAQGPHKMSKRWFGGGMMGMGMGMYNPMMMGMYNPMMMYGGYGMWPYMNYGFGLPFMGYGGWGMPWGGFGWGGWTDGWGGWWGSEDSA